MKKIISLVLAMLVLAVAAVPVFAADSPGETQKYTVNVSSSDDSRGTVTKTLNEDGTVTLTANPVTNEFTEWVITGEYELASGKLTDKTIVVKLLSDATAVANFNGKTIGGGYTVNISSSDDSRGTVTKTLNEDGTVTLTASSITHEFTEWVITGEYELASGKLTDKTIVVRLLSDATAVANFNGKAIGGSPQTGTSAVPALMLLSLISAGAALYSCKRLCR